MDESTATRAGEAVARAGTEVEYGIGAVARRLGVPASTLRTWNLRYGIGPSRRSAGGHRRYDAVDLRRLEEMDRLVKAGVPPAEAARAALRPLQEFTRAAFPVQVAPPVTGLDSGADKGERGRTAVSGGTADQEHPPSPDSAGEAVPQVTGLVRAALNLDDRAVVAGLDAALDRHGVAWTWERLVLPVYAAITRRQELSGRGIEIEHLFSERLLSALVGRAARPERPAHPRPVLLACAQEEQHCLAVYALAAALTSADGLETRVLGPRTPPSALADAMRRMGPSAVFVWSQRAATGDPAALRALPVLRPASRIVAGGPGWWHDALPPGVAHASSLPAAVALIRAALGH
ncbi:MerR family transcriptional regulator [Sphaerisporangium melleum]|uniref:MerR family transcriptional regulator n=1 Tax=Sphaerisporangium melleum TaxID=321316 RepID=A0A917VI61_9ACTN|nr:MerR family transcriptional regulator [Sphaerisporangium melleum]GGK85508.1 MerR family transcriptional regulator [Sphaerisporangium melleum]GII71383.1 MerR family transcriptional regulator [Sphaerisporangium melleum]